VRKGHPLSRGKLTAARYAAAKHVLFSRHGLTRGPIDQTLAERALEREIVTIVGGFATALALALVRARRQRTGAPHRQLALPFAATEITVSMLWHPRLDADQAHRWLRDCVREVVQRD
jgi:DNA-binding transcriptional LysR family regulator